MVGLLPDNAFENPGVFWWPDAKSRLWPSAKGSDIALDLRPQLSSQAADPETVVPFDVVLQRYLSKMIASARFCVAKLGVEE